jgi:hypothetical protein|tara:strand:- start:117 stop:254 length:138 start_codon:yes stop_codon:yes gene_type:complete
MDDFEDRCEDAAIEQQIEDDAIAATEQQIEDDAIEADIERQDGEP